MPDQEYYTRLTDIGRARLATALADAAPLGIAAAALGDGGGTSYDPSPDQTALVGEWHRRPVNRITVDPDNPHWVVIEVVVPMSVGGHYVREVGLIDRDGALIAIAKFPPTYKPTLIAGTGSDLVIRVILEVANAGSVELLIDPTVVTASRAYVDQTVGQSAAALHADLEAAIAALHATRQEMAATTGDYRLAPVYPEIESSGGRLPVSAEHGAIAAGAGSLIHRGGRRFALAARTFATAPNRTCHLRWLAPGQPDAPAADWPQGRLVLRDLADPAYNPSGFAEDHRVFDTGYDDALLARIVTTAANLPVATTLLNRQTLFATGGKTTHEQRHSFRDMPRAEAQLDWSRTPAVTVNYFNLDGLHIKEMVTIQTGSETRYAVTRGVFGYAASLPPDNDNGHFLSGALAMRMEA